MFNEIKKYKSDFRKSICAFAITSIVAFSPGMLVAEDNEIIKQDFEKTFQQMLANPADVDVTLRYAELAVKLEDYEAAIPALERILFFNPSSKKVRLDLGILYYNLDSYDVAKDYFMSVKNGNNVPEDIMKKADGYLNKLKAKS